MASVIEAMNGWPGRSRCVDPHVRRDGLPARSERIDPTVGAADDRGPRQDANEVPYPTDAVVRASVARAWKRIGTRLEEEMELRARFAFLFVVLVGACGGSAGVEEVGRWQFDAGDAPRIEVDNEAGPVEIEARPGSQIVVRSPAVDAAVEQDDDAVRVTHEPEGGEDAGAGFFITAPASTEFDITIERGALRMQGFGDTRVRIDLREGPVELDRVRGDIRVNASTGGIDLRDIRGTVRLATNEGPISVSGQLDGSNLIRARHGGVLVELAKGNALVVDARGSAVDAEFGLGSGRRVRGTIGDGSAGSLDIRVRKGPVEIRRAAG